LTWLCGPCSASRTGMNQIDWISSLKMIFVFRSLY